MMILSRAALSTIFGHLFLLSAVQGAKPTPPTAPTPTPPTSSCAAATKTCGANKPCNNGACCSQWGYCGTGDAYCGACCQSGCPSTPTTPTVTSPPTNQPTPNNPTPTNNPPSTCPAVSAACGPGNPCSGGLCCSQWGYCGDTEAYCGTCCQSNCWGSPTSPITTTTTSTSSASPPTGSPPSTASNEDSRLIAYLGNWQDCPSSTQVAAYTHIVIAFAVSYTWAPGKNICDSQCNVGSTLPTCGNLYRPDLINEWRNMGKKVILSFGGAGMGGSWSGDSNNCWDYCFGKEDALSTSLVDLVKSHDLDGVDIDYEYCYDVNGLQSGRCSQRSSIYTDAKAQTFLNSLTSKLRIKLDALQTLNGYNRGRYEVTHAPMDVDVSRTDSKYYGILKARHADLDFLMPQFYNGVTRPAVDGVTGTGAGSLSAVSIFNILANDMFQAEPQKVVFGFCISDCGGTGSNVNANQAALVLTDLKAYNQGVFGCNGGAFFWVAQHDIGGTWSSTVMAEVGKTAGCSATMTTTSTAVTSTTSTTSSSTTTSKPTNAPTSLSPTAKPVSSTTSTTSTMTTATSKPTNAPTSRSPTAKPITKAPVTLAPVSAPPSTSPPSTSKPTSSGTGELVISTSPRCGISEIDARERCQQECTSSADCPSGQWCWGTHPNLCGSIKQRVYTNPVQSTVWTRCGTDEIFARTFCTQECTWQGQCPSGQDCIALNPNYCGSPYYEV